MALFGESKVISLARALLLERVRNDPMAQANGFTPNMVNSLSGDQIAGSTEAAIASITESIASLTLKGFPEEDAIRRIEAHRRTLGHNHLFAPDDGAEVYIRYRVDVEHKGPPLPDGHLEYCMTAAEHFFRHIDGKGDLKHALLFAEHARTVDRLELLLDHLVMAVRNDDSDSYDHLLRTAEAWELERTEQTRRRDVFLLRTALRNM